MPFYYSKYLGPKLTERVHEALNKPHDEQVALYEELAIARGMAVEALKLSQPLFDDDMSKKLNPETKVLLIQNLNQAMSFVKEMVLAASKIEKESKEQVSIKAVGAIVEQIILTINEVCGTEHQEILEAITKAIDERVRVPMFNKTDQTVEVNLLPTTGPTNPKPVESTVL